MLCGLEEVVTVLFCLIDDAYRLLYPHVRRYESLKRLSVSEVISLARLQQLRGVGVESERSPLRDASEAGFFSHLLPGVVGLHPSSLHRRVRERSVSLSPSGGRASASSSVTQRFSSWTLHFLRSFACTRTRLRSRRAL